MARIFTCGFELNSTTDGVEFISVVTGSPTIQTTVVRSGTYALQINPSAAAQSLAMVFNPAATLKTVFHRFYYRAAVHPASASLVFTILDVSNSTSLMRLRGTGSGLRALNSANVQVGSDFALNTNQWYRIDIKLFSNASTGTIDVLVDGNSVVSVTGQNTGGQDAGFMLFGSAAALTHNYYIDDIADNDANADTFSTNTSYPGAGKIICIRPAGAGTSAQFTRGGTDTGANWSQNSEITPDDATTYVQDGTMNDADMYAIGSSGIGSSDTIKAVCVGGRFTNDVTDALTAFSFKAVTANGTITSAGIVPGQTTWKTNSAATNAAGSYPICKDDDSGLPWEASALNGMQIGAAIIRANVNKIRMSTVWAMVDYAPVYPKSTFVRQAVNRAATY